MRKILVAVCGAPMVGKTQIIQQLSVQLHAPHITAHATETERIVSLHVDWQGEHMLLHALSGNVFNEESSISKILMGVNAVVYVMSPEPPAKRIQVRYFEQFSQQATMLHASWDDVPWIFVLNKTDISQENPLLEYMPPLYRDKIISSVATKGQGISDIWDRVTTLDFADS